MVKKAKQNLGVSALNTDITSILTLIDTVEAGMPTTKAQWVTTLLRTMRVDLKHLQGYV